MSDATDDPRCPECGEPVSPTAAYCMHCSADFGEDGPAQADEAGEEGQAEPAPNVTDAIGEATSSGDRDEQLLDPEGIVDDTLTVLVGIAGGIVVGVVGTAVLLIVTGSGWSALFGLLAWLGATAYLVRCRTVQAAVSKGSYAVALVLLLVPVVAFSPIMEVDGGSGERGGLFVVLLVFVAIPAGVAAGVGWIASRFVPESPGADEA